VEPRLIAEVLAADHHDDKLKRVSHETVYRCLYVHGRGQLRADLNKRLAIKRAARKPAATLSAAGSSNDVITIRKRPAEVADRAVPGHWEGDVVRYEALCDRAEVRDLRRCAVAAA
jgi:IS30 family transposase